MSGRSRTVRALSTGALALLLALAAAPARAGAAPRDVGADVDAAEQLYAKNDWPRAIEQAELVLRQHGLSHDQLVRSTRVLAVGLANLGKQDLARDVLLQLLVYEPDLTLDPSLGTKVTTPFSEARGQLRGYAQRPGLDVATDVHADGGELRVTTRDPTKIVRRVVAGYRWTSSGEYTAAAVTLGEGSIEVVAAPAGRTRLDFYVQALDDRDNAVFEAGNPAFPKSTFTDPTPPPPPPAEGRGDGKKSLVASPLFWVLTGAAVVGGGLALYFALKPGGEGSPTAASLSPVIRCGASKDLCP
jgi:hypothetical protein